jgi:hypothetical protein
LVAHRHGNAFGPARRDVGEHQRVHEIPIGLDAAAVLDHIHLQESRRWITPIAEGANWNRAPQCHTDAAASTTLAIDVSSRFAEQTIDGGRADL